MFNDIDMAVKSWLDAALRRAGTTVQFAVETAAPRRVVEIATVFAFLTQVSRCERSNLSEAGSPSLQLNYLVTVIAPEVAAARQILGSLLYGALEMKDGSKAAVIPARNGVDEQMGWQPLGYEVDLEPIPTALWQAMGVSPEPSLMLRVPVVARRPQPRSSIVTEPLLVQSLMKSKD